MALVHAISKSQFPKPYSIIQNLIAQSNRIVIELIASRCPRRIDDAKLIESIKLFSMLYPMVVCGGFNRFYLVKCIIGKVLLFYIDIGIE